MVGPKLGLRLEQVEAGQVLAELKPELERAVVELVKLGLAENLLVEPEQHLRVLRLLAFLSLRQE